MDIDAVIANYLLTPQGKYLLKDPEHTVSNCANASWDFRTFTKKGNLMFCSVLRDTTNVHPYWVGDEPDHMVWIYRKKVVDFTYPQFDPSLPFPLVESISRYERRFKHTYLEFSHDSRTPLREFKKATKHARKEVREMLADVSSNERVLAQERKWLELSLQKVQTAA